MLSKEFVWFILRRILLIVLILFGVITITFIISRVIPGDPITLITGIRAGSAGRATVAAEYGLDKPLYIQYFSYLYGIFTGNLGLSISTQHPVFADIAQFLPASLELIIPTMMITIPLSMFLGIVSAKSKDRLPDHIARLISLSGFAIPPFWLGLILQYILGYDLHLLPISGRIDPLLGAPPHITGIYVIDGLMTGDWPVVNSSLLHLILPVITLTVGFWSTLVRLLRSSMLDVLGQDYIRTAKASGIPERTINYRYALRNAFLPTATSMGLAFGYLFGGTVLVETIFNWPGLGLYITKAVLFLDFPGIIGATFVFALLFMIINFVTDLAYGVIDPRVRYGK